MGKNIAYITRYNRENYKNVSFKLSIRKDKDIIKFLNDIEDKSGLIKRLIRGEMERH